METDHGFIMYADSLIRQVHAGPEYQVRLEKCRSDEEAQLLIAELEAMRLPLAYERTPYTVIEIGEAQRFLADKDDFYERNHIASIR